MKKLKIIMIGPCQAGKTIIANYLSQAIENVSDDYRPTKGVRIIEFEIKDSYSNAEVELWDCSGDHKYENVWPVFLWNANGIVLVYNPDIAEHLQQLDVFYNQLVVQSLMTNSNCLIIAHYKDAEPKHTPPELSGDMSHVSQISANVLENGEELRISFSQFISSVLNDTKSSNNELDNLSIFNMSD